MDIIVSVVANLAIPLGLLLLGWLVGRARERSHLQLLDARERQHAHQMLVIDLEEIPGAPGQSIGLVMGGAVIATDYFKTLAATLRAVFGGEVRSFQTLLTRARREAHARMVDEALRLGADTVVNVRFQTSDIGGQRSTQTEVFCYGTAVRRG